MFISVEFPLISGYISLVPMKSRASAMISLTGDTELNRHMRLKAIKAGMHLNEFGLWRWVSNDSPGAAEKEAKADTEGAAEASEEKEQRGFWQLIPTSTEEDIFREVGMDYVEPHRRNFAFLDMQAVPKRKKTARKSVS
jgi:DNA polymerase beta